MKKKEKLQKIGRVAFREEGEMWNVYYAEAKTMQGSILLSSIRISIVRANPEFKQAYMDLMRDVVGKYLKDIVGGTPAWGEAETAPEAERSGHA